MKISYNGNVIVFYMDKALLEVNINNKEELEGYIKKIIPYLKTKNINITSGLYIARIYINKKYGLIIELENIEELEFFKDMIDLKVIIFDEAIFYLEVSDYFLIKDKNIIYNDGYYYVNIEELDDIEIIKLADFSKVIYGDCLTYIREKGKLINSR